MPFLLCFNPAFANVFRDCRAIRLMADCVLSAAVSQGCSPTVSEKGSSVANSFDVLSGV